MAITFPLSLAAMADNFPASQFSMELMENQNVLWLASGEPVPVNRMPMMWAGSAQSVAKHHGDALELEAALRVLDGARSPFYLYDFRKKYPSADLDGALFGAATPIISAVGSNNKSISITGLPANYVLTAGDRFHAPYSTSRRFYGEFSESVTADGTGAIASIEVRPHLRPGFLAGVALTIIKPAAKVKLVPGSLKVTGADTLTSAVVFSFQQTLAA